MQEAIVTPGCPLKKSALRGWMNYRWTLSEFIEIMLIAASSKNVHSCEVVCLWIFK
jgi:hypothetical protein